MEGTERPPGGVPAASAADEQLLPGEEPDSVYVDDAVHWIGVYKELIRVRKQLLDHLDLPEASREPV